MVSMSTQRRKEQPQKLTDQLDLESTRSPTKPIGEESPLQETVLRPMQTGVKRTVDDQTSRKNVHISHCAEELKIEEEPSIF